MRRTKKIRRGGGSVTAEEEANEANSSEAEPEEESGNSGIMLTSDSGSSLSEGGALSSGTYTLTADVTPAEALTVASGETVTIDLAGYTLTGAITITGGTLTIKDSTATENVSGSGGTVTGNITVSDGSLTIKAGNYTGTLSGDYQTATIEFATFSSKISSSVLGYLDEGDYFYYQNPGDSKYVYTNSARYESVTINGTTTYYTDFASAMSAANVKDQTATLLVLDNSYSIGGTAVNITSGIDIVGDVTIKFNENATINASVTTDYIFQVCSGASLTILNNPSSPIGNAKSTSTENGGIGIYVNGGTLTLGNYAYVAGYYGVKIANGGTLNASGSEATIKAYDTAVYVENGTVNLSNNSGVLSAGTYGVYLASSDCTLNISGGASIDSDTYGVYSVGGAVNITGSSEINGDTCGVYAKGGTVSMTGAGYITGKTGVYLDGASMTMSAGDINGTGSGSEYGIYAKDSTVLLNGNFGAIVGQTIAGIYADNSSVTMTGLTSSSEVASNATCVSANNNSVVTIDSGWFDGNSSCITTDSTSSVTITGGRYTSNVTEYCASGCEVTASTGVTEWEVTGTPTYVASVTIGETTTNYTTVAAAIKAAGTSEATVTFLQTEEGLTDYTYNITISNGQNITLSSAVDNHGTITVESGATLTAGNGVIGDSVTVASDATLNFSGGTANNVTVADGATVNISSGGVTETLTVNGGTVNMTGGSVESATINSGAVTVSGGTLGSESVSVKGGTLTVSDSGKVSGSVTVSSGEVNVTGGTINANSGMTISGGTVTVSSGTLTVISSEALTVSNGTLNINGGTVKAIIAVTGGDLNMTDGSMTSNGDAGESAITVSNGTATISGGTVKCSSEFGGNAVKVTGGTVTITDGSFIGGMVNETTQSDAVYLTSGTLTISGGHFSSNLADTPSYIAEGYSAYTEETGTTYEVAGIPYTVQRLAKFYTRTVTLNSGIAINYYVDLTNVTDEDARKSYTVVFTVDGESQTATYDSSSYRAFNGTDYYRFTVDLTSVQLATTFTAELKCGDTTVQTDTYSMQTYCQKKITASSTSDLAKLCAALLNYGSYAQTYFGVNTEALANASLKTWDSTWTDLVTTWNEDLSSYATGAEITGDVPSAITEGSDSVNKFAASLVLDSVIRVRIYFNSTDTSGLTFTQDGNVLTINSVDTDNANYGTYSHYVEYTISPQNLVNSYNVIVSDSSDTATISYTAMNYVYTVVNGSTGAYSESLTNLCKALYYYSAAEIAYLG